MCIRDSFRIEDAQPMYENWASDPEVTNFLMWPAHPSVEVSREVLKSWICQYSDEKYYQWAIAVSYTHLVLYRSDRNPAEIVLSSENIRRIYHNGIIL